MAEPPATVLDQRGRRCPLPIIALAKVVAATPVGGLVELYADDPAADPDVRAWCRMRGQELISADGDVFVVRRVR